ESRAAGLLVRAGVPVANARTCIRQTANTARESVTIPAILGHAHDLALEFSGERTPGTEHVLLSLLRSAHAIREPLKAAGLDMDQIENAFQRSTSSPLQ